MTEILIAFIAGGSMSAIVSGIFSLILYKSKKKDENEDKEDVVKKGLRYIMLYIIQERAEKYISNGCISVDERRSLHKWHDLYHNGLHGNGDADALMDDVDALPLRI